MSDSEVNADGEDTNDTPQEREAEHPETVQQGDPEFDLQKHDRISEIGPGFNESHPLYQAKVRPAKWLTTGMFRTNPDLVRYFFNEAFASKTLGQLFEEVQHAMVRVKLLGVFSSLTVELLHPSRLSPSEVADDEELTLAIHVKESKMVEIGMHNETGTDGTDFKANAKLKNYFGRGEHVDAEVQMGAHPSNVRVGFSKPLLYGSSKVPKTFDVHAFHTLRDNRELSNHAENINGITARKFYGLHQFAYECSWRTVHLGPNPSAPLVSQAGHSLKSSLRHEYAVDVRDNALCPSTGYAYKVATELAGFGGDVHFFKPEAAFQYNIPLPRKLGSIQYSIRGGLLLPLASPPQGFPLTRVNDRFFLGGATSVRGFATRGIGPRRGIDGALGGDIYYNSNVHIATPLPSFGNAAMRDMSDYVALQVFANSGNLVQWDRSCSFADSCKSLTQNARGSVGAGVVVMTALGRFELNACRPVRATLYDNVSNRLQFGFTTSFSL